jgi:hypothetical protein
MSSTSTPLPDALAKIVERFQKRTNPKQRYEQLLLYAKRLKEMPEVDKLPEKQSPWLHIPSLLNCQLGRWQSLVSRRFGCSIGKRLSGVIN